METPDGFEAINAEYRARVTRYLAGLVGDAALAEDLAQEALLRVHRGLPDLRDPGARTAWVFRIATNVAFDHLRTPAARVAGRTISVDDGGDADEPSGLDLPSDDPSADSRLEQTEMAACLRRYAERLPPTLRATLLLRDLEGLGEREVAQVLGCSLAAVKVRTHRARRALRARLRAECDFYQDGRGVLRCEPAGRPA